MQGLSHKQASTVFKTIREGQVLCYVARRIQEKEDERHSCEELQLL